MSRFDESWLQPGGVVPVDVETTGLLVDEILRLRASACKHELRRWKIEEEGDVIATLRCDGCGAPLDRARRVGMMWYGKYAPPLR